MKKILLEYSLLTAAFSLSITAYLPLKYIILKKKLHFLKIARLRKDIIAWVFIDFFFYLSCKL